METAEISYRVADFLKKHPPFNAIGDEHLLALAARGRVRFHEPFEYILWQGEPHRHQVFVIQQGTVSLWDESAGRAELRDIRGAGDLLGIDRYTDAPHTMHSARSESDVVIYAFPTYDFDEHILTSAHAAEYVAAEGRPTADYHGGSARREPHRTFLHSLAGKKHLTVSSPADSVAQAAERLLAAGSRAVAVVGADQRLHGVLTADRLIRWIADGGGDARGAAVETLMSGPPAVVPSDATVSDGVLAMIASEPGVLVMTADGTAGSNLQAVITASDLSPLFGDHPALLLREVRQAVNVDELRDINQRARALTLDYLSSASAVEWLAQFTYLVDAAIVTRLLTLLRIRTAGDCWCFAGSSGREESLTLLAPQLVILLADSRELHEAREQYLQVVSSLESCGYLSRTPVFDRGFYVASSRDWIQRYRNWVSNPVIEQMYLARTLFDLRWVAGSPALWTDVADAVSETVDRDFLYVLANDCLASLPPLTFYEDAVVDSAGDYVATFKLDESALRPLVDVGRVFGMAAGSALGRSTLERLETARTLLPDHEDIFREAAVTFRTVLWQQARVGITQGDSGAELAPALLSRHDRHLLKSGFRSILRLIQFTAGREWLTGL